MNQWMANKSNIAEISKIQVKIDNFLKDFSLIVDTRFVSRTSKSGGFGEFLSSTLQNTLKT